MVHGPWIVLRLRDGGLLGSIVESDRQTRLAVVRDFHNGLCQQLCMIEFPLVCCIFLRLVVVVTQWPHGRGTLGGQGIPWERGPR